MLIAILGIAEVAADQVPVVLPTTDAQAQDTQGPQPAQ